MRERKIVLWIVLSAFVSLGYAGVALPTIINKSNCSTIKYDVDNYGELLTRFGKASCLKLKEGGLECALCYETWMSGHLKGFLHIYQRVGKKWYMRGVIIVSDPQIPSANIDGNKLYIASGQGGDYYEIPLYRK